MRAPTGLRTWSASLSTLVVTAALLAGAPAALAQDKPSAGPAQRAMQLLAITGPRTSPFNPPDKDVFLTDGAPGLDTGCTFNTSSLNPLTIDVMVDSFVGDVDANGYLVNPAPLISAGIVPASVEILLPAFDIDYNGAAPPERDELLFNGQSLGFLTGDDNIWKLNSFRVDIRKIKFPARPAAGALPAPVANRIQIRIDTLSTGRWCTQIDWVALLLPIRPKLALELDVVAGNPVYSNTGVEIKRIYEQRFDANCNVSEFIGPIDQYPFSGPMLTAANGTGSAKLKARVKTCPANSLPPTQKVVADWEVAGTTRKGSTSWTGSEGTVEYMMPQAVNSHDAKLKLTLDNGQTIDVTRRLFVTRKVPLLASPRVNWYKQGTSWAAGQTTEAGIVDKVLPGVYAYGGANWRYGYFPGKCNWQELMANPVTCNYSDCYVFSDVLHNISALLGVGGLTPVVVEGTSSIGFLTTGAPSIDPAFRGNARELGTAPYNKYRFSSHSLRLRGGSYYDATFNGKYGSPSAFVMANFDGSSGADGNGFWEGTHEGKRVYARPGHTYDTWGKNDYAFLTNSPFALLAALGGGMMVPTALGGSDLAFPGTARFTTPDADGNGRFDQLVVDVDVDVATAGDYVLLGRLVSNGGLLISNRPALESMQITRADLSAAAPGRVVARLRFSGEQIRRARIDGPWQVQIIANGATGAAGSGSVTTPPLRAADFGERKIGFSAVSAAPLDADGNSQYDTVRVQATVDVANAGHYALRTHLLGAGNGLASDTRMIALAAGTQDVVIDLPAVGIVRAGVDAPYDISMELAELNGTLIDSGNFQLVGYIASQFQTPVKASTSLIEQLIDSDGNRLYDLLRVSVDLQAATALPVTIAARLVAVNGASIDADASATLSPTAQRVVLDFSGPLLRRQQMSSLYTLELSFRSPTTLEEIDAVTIPLRGAYQHAQFDTGEPARAISLAGVLGSVGVDTNGNGLFDLVRVTFGLDVVTGSFYQWSARLVDRNGAELGFATGSGSLVAGSTNLAVLQFAGQPIGVNGLDGPFFLRSLLVSGSSGANLVAPFAGETTALQASKFEGFVNRPAADLNGDGVVDAKDLEAFNKALGSSLGEANYNRFADYDRDGRVTLNDLRHFRGYYLAR